MRTPLPRLCLRTRAQPSSHMGGYTLEERRLLLDAIRRANEVCSDTHDDVECAIVWDEVEDIFRGLNTRVTMRYDDPLDMYCDDVPDADECRMYD
jgi:hypothetical protein